jgi:hypothetical protein
MKRMRSSIQAFSTCDKLSGGLGQVVLYDARNQLHRENRRACERWATGDVNGGRVKVLGVGEAVG